MSFQFLLSITVSTFYSIEHIFVLCYNVLEYMLNGSKVLKKDHP